MKNKRIKPTMRLKRGVNKTDRTKAQIKSFKEIKSDNNHTKQTDYMAKTRRKRKNEMYPESSETNRFILNIIKERARVGKKEATWPKKISQKKRLTQVPRMAQIMHLKQKNEQK